MNDQDRLVVADCRLEAFKAKDFDSDAEFMDVLVVPAGNVQSMSGDFVMDKDAWLDVEKAFRAQGNSLLFDYEHQSMGKPYNLREDGLAPAAGEIVDLRWDADRGVIAKVRWTDEARRRIKAREYRYPSPVIWIRKDNGRAKRLTSVGLVNEPAIVGMERIAAKAPLIPVVSEKETTMELQKELQKCLGAADTDTAEVLVNRVGELKTKAKTADASAGTVKAVCKALGVAETASEAEIVVAINSAKQSKDAATAMQGELTVIKNKLADRDADDRMRPHIAANKINPNATEDVTICKRLAAENPEAFERLMEERQAYVAPGRTTPPEGPAKKSAGAKEQELIANSVKANGNNYGKGIVALQTDLVRPYLDAGLTTKAARERCEQEYPTVFAD